MKFVLAVLAVTACQQVPTRYEFLVEARAQSDLGEPIANVAVVAGNLLLGRTDAAGSVRASLPATPGTAQTIQFLPPPTWRPVGPSEDKVDLRMAASVEGGAPRPQPVSATAVFAPPTRGYVVMIKTNLPELPIKIGGKRVAATNEFGVTQIAYDAPPGGDVTVQIDTSGRLDLTPQGPARTFRLEDRDDVLLIAQDFETVRPAPVQKAELRKFKTRRGSKWKHRGRKAKRTLVPRNLGPGNW